jgi:hypothetical protein
MTFAQIVEKKFFRFSGSWITYYLQVVLTSLRTRAVTSLLELGGGGWSACFAGLKGHDQTRARRTFETQISIYFPKIVGELGGRK